MNPIPATPRSRSAKATVSAVDYGFQLSDEIERQMRRCRASVRTAIRAQVHVRRLVGNSGQRHGYFTPRLAIPYLAWRRSRITDELKVSGH